jgi:hypothetical protein
VLYTTAVVRVVFGSVQTLRMGNSQPRYFNDKEALEIIGKHTAERLTSQLNQNGRYLDYNLFSQIIAVQFDRMVSSPFPSPYHPLFLHSFLLILSPFSLWSCPL